MAELVVVPARLSAASLTLRCGRLVSGQRVGIAFTSSASLIRVMGADQRWIRIATPALKAMLAPLGIDRIQLDPAAVTPVREGPLVPAANVREACDA